MNPRYTFDFPFRIFLAILPFMTVLSIFTREKLGIPRVSFLKEGLLFMMLLTVLWSHVTYKKRIYFSIVDILIAFYIFVLIGISLFTTGVSGIIYGGRYDFSFFLAFLVIYHGGVFLEKSWSYYLKIFLISGGIMLFCSALLKWPLSEDLLLYLGYSGNPSNWQFGSSIPIFHGVDGANVRRFQGLLDGPNVMGAFLLIYSGFFVYYFRQHKNWHFFIGCLVSLFLLLIVYTYSRSAILGFFVGVGFIILFQLSKILKHYRAQFLTTAIVVFTLLGIVFFQYAGTMKAIVARGGSTSGHIERMKIGLVQFQQNPLGHGLGSSGPAYRYLQKLENTDRKIIEELDKMHIPESWYIQQMVEGGVLGIFLFLSIIFALLQKLFKRSVILAGTFISLLVMNFFLHTFESSIVSFLLFSLIGLVLSKHEKSG